MSQASQAVFQGISLLLTQHRVAEARAELERLLNLDPEDPEARAQAADVYAYTGAQTEAYRHYHWAAETYNRLGRADMALAVHHKMLELDPAALDSATQTRLRLLGLLVAAEDAIIAGRHEEAVAAYQEAIRLFPNHTISYQRLANLWVRLNRIDEAAAQYLTVARAFYAHGVRGKARPYFERVLELLPSHTEALDDLLDCLKAENKEPEGVRYVRAAVQALLQAGQKDAAKLWYARLADLEPLPVREASGPDLRRDAVGTPQPIVQVAALPGGLSIAEQTAWRTLGEVCLGEGLFEEARWIFGRLLSARPNYPVYSELLRRAENGLAAPPAPAFSLPTPPPLPPLPVPFRPTPSATPFVRASSSAPGSPLLPPWPGPSRRRAPARPSVPRLATIQPTAHAFSFGEPPSLEIGPLDDSDELIE